MQRESEHYSQTIKNFSFGEVTVACRNSKVKRCCEVQPVKVHGEQAWTLNLKHNIEYLIDKVDRQLMASW